MKIVKLKENAIIPTKGSEYAAGYDLYSCETGGIEPGKSKMFGTGLAMEIPKGYFGAIFARSGLSCKKGLRPSTCVSVIDSDYRGEVMIPLYNDSMVYRNIKAGDRISQLVIIPCENIDFELVETLEQTQRNKGGFGSTGKD